MALINKKLLVCTIEWEPLIQSIQNLVARLDLGGILLETILGDFFFKCRMCFSQGQTKTKRRRIGCILDQLCDPWPHPWIWPWIFQGTWNRRDMSRSFLTMTVTFGLPWWGRWMYWIVTGWRRCVVEISSCIVQVLMICNRHLCQAISISVKSAYIALLILDLLNYHFHFKPEWISSFAKSWYRYAHFY